MRTPLEDIGFLARSEHRVNALAALTAGPQARDELRIALDASSATVGRLLAEFESRTWIQRIGQRYELTSLGEYIAQGFFELVNRFETEHSIRDVWQWFPTELGFTVEMFAGATITPPNNGNPYLPNARYVELLESSTSLREVGTIPLKPENFKAILY